MIVYHGSYTRIEKVDLSKSRTGRDFGRGFYVTKYREHAETWAQKLGARHHTQGYVTEFDFWGWPRAEETCAVKRFEAYNEEWLDFVVMNRKTENTHNYDIVEGPVADDKVQTRIDVYLAGYIPKNVFLNELTYHEDTHQICFCTIAGLQLLSFVHSKDYFKIKRMGEDITAALVASGMDERAALDAYFESDTYRQLIDTNTGLHLKPWEEVLAVLEKELGKSTG